MAQTLLSKLPASGVTDVFDEIQSALLILQVQQRQIMSQDLNDPEESLCLLDKVLDLHIEHMKELIEELVTKGSALTGQSTQEG